MLPLKDDNPSRMAPVVTWALVAINVAVFVYQVMLGPAGGRLVMELGVVPARLFAAPGETGGGWLNLVSAMFLHGGFMHLAGNMLYLWIFGDNVEEAMGRVRFILFYLVCGMLAALAHALAVPASNVPMIGASGAISGVLGAYLLLYPRARVLVFVPFGFFSRLIYVPALVMLGVWMVIQVLNGMLSMTGSGSGVAWFAHMGGFAAGMLLVVPFKRRDVPLFRRW